MSSMTIFAQCVMCYRSAAAQGAARGRVFDLGIVILLIPPALILTGILVRAVRSDAHRISSREWAPGGSRPDHTN